ncbi:hypothetical protein DUI87_08163 [Hirundo rustica rustica]|uniref:Uncharacterized protein n=1 Tax=Hirundo rustica rustica TaxID=333673 RepID=A0A3M0KSR4_HIRRU|nr:hypothetical protein DUI87_08163 [Hirundo rustica rustica]
MFKGLEHLSYKERELSLFGPEKRQQRKELFSDCKNLKEQCQEDGVSLFLQPSNSMRSIRQKLTQMRFQWNKNFFTVQAPVHWNRLPRDVVESPSLEIFKSHLDTTLCNVL